MKILFATNNAHKLTEVQAVLGDSYTLVTPRDCGVTEEIPETQPTLEGNALQKARYLYERTGLDCFADDTGLEVEALGSRIERHVILIDPDQQAVLADRAGHLHRVAGAAERAIAPDGPALQLKRCEHLLEHDRFMPIFWCQRSRCHARTLPGPLVEEIRERALHGGLAGLVRRAIPDHQAVVVTHDGHLAIEMGFFPDRLGKADTGGGVYFKCGCRAVQSLLDHAVLLIGGAVAPL